MKKTKSCTTCSGTGVTGHDMGVCFVCSGRGIVQAVHEEVALSVPANPQPAKPTDLYTVESDRAFSSRARGLFSEPVRAPPPPDDEVFEVERCLTIYKTSSGTLDEMVTRYQSRLIVMTDTGFRRAVEAYSSTNPSLFDEIVILKPHRCTIRRSE